MKTYQDLPLHTLIDKIFKAERERQIRTFTLTANDLCDRLNKYFTISSMQVVGSQYWNQIHGRTAEDAKKDLEGLQTMRTLGQNMAWMLKNMENGAEHPAYEKRLRTDFIRR